MYRTKDELKELLIPSNSTLRDAVKAMDNAHLGIISIVDEENHFLGIFTDGDFRNSILQGIDLSTSILKVINENPIVIDKKNANANKIKNCLNENSIFQLPIIDNNLPFFRL